jgi:hypothetical protein
MIRFLFILFLGGVGLTIYGVWEQKNVYGDQYFAVGRVVGRKLQVSSNPFIMMGNAAMQMSQPIVAVTLDSGETRQLVIHTPVSYSSLGSIDQFPELRVGGEVSVTYFGTNPKEAFLVDHPLAQAPMKCSALLLVGLALIGTVIVVGVFTFWIARNF